MKYQYGFIGTGNMGAALAAAVCRKVPASAVAVSNRSPEKAKALAEKLGCVFTTNEDIAQNSDCIVLGVKPQMLEGVLDSIKYSLDECGKQLLVTMAAGVTMETLSGMAGGSHPIIRIMPNTPVAIGAGVILAAKNDFVPEAQFEAFMEDFSEAGTLKALDEDLIDAGSVVSGCGPAYVYMYIDALAKAGEKLGLSYEMAADLAKATVKGSADLSEVSPNTLEELRVAVCSPGGSTIEGVRSFQASDLNDIVEDALTAAFNRTKELAAGK